MNILYNNTRSYNYQYNTTRPKHRKNTSLKSITSCSGYERALADYPSGYKFAKPTCWSETNMDWDET